VSGLETAPKGSAPTGLVLEGRTHARTPVTICHLGPVLHIERVPPAWKREALATLIDLVAAEGRDEDSWTLRDDPCPLEGALAMDRTTGEIAWRPTCKNARCRRCSRQVSAQTFALARRALEDSGERVRFITLTLAPEGWQATRQAMWEWLQRCRRAGYVMNVLWVVEEGSETGMRHIHVVQTGSYVPKAFLSDSWPFGSTQIEGARAATNYLAKGVVRYVAKGLDGDGASIEAHMNLNGGRAAHWSNEFFDGKGRNAYRAANPLPGVYFVETVR
jgi:hypothetical protein